MMFPGFEAYTDVTCLQVIAKKEVIAKNRGKEGGGEGGAPSPAFASATSVLKTINKL